MAENSSKSKRPQLILACYTAATVIITTIIQGQAQALKANFGYKAKPEKRR